MRDRRGEADSMMHRTAAQERKIESLPVVGDQEIMFPDDPLYLGDHGALLGVIAREELAENKIAVPDVAEPDEKHGRGLEAAGLDVEEEHPTVAELAEEAPLRRVEFRDGFGERAGLATRGLAMDGRPHAVNRFALTEHRQAGMQRQPVGPNRHAVGIDRDPMRSLLSQLGMRDQIELLQQLDGMLVQLGVETLVHEACALSADNDPAGEDVLDRCGDDSRLRAWKGNLTPRLAPQEIANSLPERGRDHRGPGPAIR